MQVLGVLALLVAAATALPADLPVEVKGDDRLLYRCSLNPDRNLFLKERKLPFYSCVAEGKDQLPILLVTDSQSEPSIEAFVEKETLLKLQDPSQRPKRQGFGLGAAGAQSQATAGGFGGGFGGGGFGGPGFGGGFGGGGAQSSANAFSQGGGFGGGYNQFG